MTTTNNHQSSYQLTKTPEFDKWFKKLKDSQAKKQILGRLLRIQEDGFFGDSKGVGDNISELRFHVGAGYRIYYAVLGDVVVLLLCGGDKGSQTKDIRQAKDILKTWSDNHE